MTNIRNIIFDLGGVILNIDFNRTEQAFIDLGVTNFSELYTQYHATDLFKDFEKGLISPAEFREAFRKTLPHLTDDDIDGAWNAMLLDFPPGRINLLKRLKTHYRTFVLSNTNSIHHAAFSKIELRTGDLEDTIDRCFEKVYYSHEVHMRKPDREIYEFVLRENGLVAGETLFIDDTPANVSAANSVGIKGVFLEKPQTMEKLFEL